MSTETQELELAPDETLVEQMKRADLPVIWDGYRAQAEKLKMTAETLTITDVSQVAEMKIARTTRLALREIRVAVDKKRLELVEGIKAEAKKIDGAAKAIKDYIEPLEARLLDQEQFIERETLRIEDGRRESRHVELKPFLTSPLSIDLGKLPDEEYAKMLADAKDLAALREERIRKEREAAEAEAKAEAEERERIRLENERLKKEAEETKRLALIENRIQAIREGETDVLRVCKTVESIENEIEYVEARPITEELFQERLEDARATKDAVLVAMRAILAERKAAEAEALAEKERIEKERDAERKLAADKLAAEQDKAREEAIAAQKAREQERKKWEAEAERQRAEATKARKEQEEKARKEREAADKENARLAGIAEQERQKAATAAREAKEAREKIEREEAARKAAEAKAEADRLAAEEAARLAPEKDKLMAFAAVVRALVVPTMETEKGNAVAVEIESQVVKFAAFIEKKAGAL